MAFELSNQDRSPLLPDRLDQGDFFVCDIFNAAPKGDMASMEHPIFSISTKPDRRVRRYESGKNFVEITPSIKGLATVHDRDVLIFCISQVIAALNQDKKVSQVVHFKAYDMLKATNRMTNGQAYEGLVSALTRLRGTTITTNIITGNEEVSKGFGLIESFEIVRKPREGRMQEIKIKLSDWVFNAIRHKEVLTLHRDYFRLRKPLERRIYEIARKHCGMQASWKIGLQRLQEKCGSTSTLKEFRRLLQKIVFEDEAHNHMPDYALSLKDDMVAFFNRRMMDVVISPNIAKITLDPEAYHDARTVAPGWDIYVLEGEWRQWMHEYDVELPRNPTKAFIGFCRKHAQKHGLP
jgi:hypothetical protein